MENTVHYLINAISYAFLALCSLGLFLCVYALCMFAYTESGFGAAMANFIVFGLPVIGLVAGAFISFISE